MPQRFLAFFAELISLDLFEEVLPPAEFDFGDLLSCFCLTPCLPICENDRASPALGWISFKSVVLLALLFPLIRFGVTVFETIL